MDWVFFQIKAQDYSNSLSPSHQPFSPPPPSSVQSDNNTLNKISPSILLIIVILAIIFFISGLLHLLVRFLFRPSNRDTDDSDNVTALQGQLQQLFHLHDSGVDQSYIDTLPVFLYKAIIGLKNPFDCAVCLCEFEADDKLRLLPKCSHAFHLECIDTWLLSHSTCPLCRGSLLPEFPYNSSCSPVVLVLESGSESSREIVSNRDLAIASSVAGCLAEDDFGSSCTDCSQKLNEITDRDDGSIGVGSVRIITGVEEKVVTVKLGKFRNVDADQGEGTSNSNNNSNTNSNVDARRCFSMGSFEYVMDESSSLQVPIRPQVRKQNSKNKKPAGMLIPLTPGHRAAMSECDYHSSREEGFKGFDTLRSIEIHSTDNNVNSISRNKKDSFSFSKIWLRSKKEKPVSIEATSRRAFSFRFPLPKAEAEDDLKTKDSMFIFQKPEAANDLKTKDYNSNNTSRRTISEIDVSRWESSSSERSVDEETGNCNNSLESQPSMPSFARRTLLWLAGKQNKVVHSSSPDV